MSVFDWATGGVQDVVDLLAVDNINIIFDLANAGPGTPNVANPGSISDVIAGAIQRDGFNADAKIYDAIRGGIARVNCPLTVGDVPLTSLASNDETKRIVARHSAILVARMGVYHRDVQSSALPANLSKKIMDMGDDTEAWLYSVAMGNAGQLLDRGSFTAPYADASSAQLGVGVGDIIRGPWIG